MQFFPSVCGFSLLSYPGAKLETLNLSSVPLLAGVPKVMHYGLLFAVGEYQFDKHWHYDFDVTKCPPWDLSDPKHRTAGVFAHPPRPSELKNKVCACPWDRE